MPSSPIVPVGDETLLFANAGMNQFKDIFMGLRTESYSRAVNSQKCLRVSGKHNDLEEVGRDTYHHTFFEMLGNWSFGDYFKAEAIEWAWKLVTEVWQIPAENLYATVFGGDAADSLPADSEAAKYWKEKTTIDPTHILNFGKKDNFWEMGATGPCGPCSELHIDLGPDKCDKKDVPGHKCEVNAGCARYIELWNLVFIQYNRLDDSSLNPLKAKSIDTGAGLERVARVLQNKTSNYDTDLFTPIIDATAKMTGHRYTSDLQSATDTAFRVIADHIRALTLAITDGATPSNDGRGYVIRRILRRAARFGRELGMEKPFLYKLVPIVCQTLGDAFSEVNSKADHVTAVIKAEEESFSRTLGRGIELFNNAADEALKNSAKVISGDQAFTLYDTFGFPLDLTRLMAEEKGLTVDFEKFEELMEKQRTRARAAQKNQGMAASLVDALLPATKDVHKYSHNQCDCQLCGFVTDDGFDSAGSVSGQWQGGIVLDKTCFYAEAGGQVGDCGTIQTDTAKFVVSDTFKIGDCVIHKGRLEQGSFTAGDSVRAIVSEDRNAIRKNHTATHVLQWALQKVVGENIAQQGSLVSSDYLRFDFTCPRGVTKDELRKIEQLINDEIDKAKPVTTVEMDKDDALKLGAMALFGEKYGQKVRVVAIGADGENNFDDAFSREFCGGTHVDNLAVIGGFKVVREESISTGVRRITAVTGAGMRNYMSLRSDVVDELVTLLKVPADNVLERVGHVLTDNRKLAKELKTAGKQQSGDILKQVKEIAADAPKISDAVIVVAKLDTASVDQARAAVDMVKKKYASAAVVFGFADGDKVTLIAAVTDDLVKKGLKAGDIVKQIAPIVGGGGGGRPQMAQAGGKIPAKIDEALDEARKMITEKLS